jgi:hypothetical protein
MDENPREFPDPSTSAKAAFANEIDMNKTENNYLQLS